MSETSLSAPANEAPHRLMTTSGEDGAVYSFTNLTIVFHDGKYWLDGALSSLFAGANGSV
jgi:hypothetical protein